MSKVFTVERPEGGEGVDVVLKQHHSCPNARYFRQGLEEEDVDLLVWNVSSYGGGMPLFTPFVVTSTEPCGVCGNYVNRWVQWGGKQIFTLS